jgi:hypothetical protein
MATQYSPGSIRGEGRREKACRPQAAKISLIRLMCGLVRERKCSLVASANYCGLGASKPVCGWVFLEPVFSFPWSSSEREVRWTRSRETGEQEENKTWQRLHLYRLETVLLLLHVRSCSFGIFNTERRALSVETRSNYRGWIYQWTRTAANEKSANQTLLIYKLLQRVALFY